MRTIGKFYEDEILCLPKRKLKKVLPRGVGEIKIDRDLFGWKLYEGKEYIECRSEEEARYLKIFLDTDVVYKVYVPKDDEHLKNILPKFEKLKNKIDEIINDVLYSVLNRNINARARREVYKEITKEIT